MKNSTVEDLYAEKEYLTDMLNQIQTDLASTCKRLVATLKGGIAVNHKTAFRTWG